MNSAGSQMQHPRYSHGTNSNSGANGSGARATVEEPFTSEHEFATTCDEMLWKYVQKCHGHEISAIKSRHNVSVKAKGNGKRTLIILQKGSVTEKGRALKEIKQLIDEMGVKVKINGILLQSGQKNVHDMLPQLDEHIRDAAFKLDLDKAELRVAADATDIKHIMETACNFLTIPFTHNALHKSDCTFSQFTAKNSGIKVLIYCCQLQNVKTDAVVAFTNTQIQLMDYLQQPFSEIMNLDIFSLYYKDKVKKTAHKVKYGDALSMELASKCGNKHFSFLVNAIVSPQSPEELRQSLLRTLRTCASRMATKVAIPASSRNGILGETTNKFEEICYSVLREIRKEDLGMCSLKEVHLVDIGPPASSGQHTFCTTMTNVLLEASRRPDSSIIVDKLATEASITDSTAQRTPYTEQQRLGNMPHRDVTPVPVKNPQTPRKLTYPFLNVTSKSDSVENTKDIYCKFKFKSAKLKVYIYDHDITMLKIDSIVNAANEKLTNGAGVARAISDAAGAELNKECLEYIATRGSLPTGKAMVTTGGKLNVRGVIHTVGPIYHGESNNDADVMILTRAIVNCLMQCKMKRFRHVAIPAISAGIFGMPVELVCKATCVGIIEFASHTSGPGSLKEIHLVNLDPDISNEMAGVFYDMKNIYCKDLKVDIIKGMKVDGRTKKVTSRPTETTTAAADTATDKIDCPICLDKPKNEKKLDRCGHVFCKSCIDQAFQQDKTCPVCKTRYGEKTGNQPKGKMEKKTIKQPLPGYGQCKTIVIDYHFDDGTQTSEHPHPGRPYRGTHRTAYLPDNAEGQEVYKLLKRAFDARLTFTIGCSVTTGRDDVVTWNDIHHKTKMEGGASQFGYPDEHYLSRVKEELAAKGIM